jgi:hypothetical protein
MNLNTLLKIKLWVISIAIVCFSSVASAQTAKNPWLIYQTDFGTSTYYTDHGTTVSGTYTYDENSPNNVYFDDPNDPNPNGTGNWVNWVGDGQDNWYNSAQTNPSIPIYQGPGVVNYVTSGYENYPHILSYGGPSFNSVVAADPTTYPLAQKNYLTYNLGETTKSIHFDSTFYFIQGLNSKPQDSFGWTLFNTAGNALMSINYTPTSATGKNTQSYSITASTYGSDGVVNQTLYRTGGSAFSPITNNVNVHLGFDITGIGTTNQAISLYNYTNTFGVGGTGTLLGTTAIQGTNYSNVGGDDISSLALTWTLANNSSRYYTNTDGSSYLAYNNYGYNSMNVANLTIAIPEPKTWALMGISGLIMVVALRRKKA